MQSIRKSDEASQQNFADFRLQGTNFALIWTHLHPQFPNFPGNETPLHTMSTSDKPSGLRKNGKNFNSAAPRKAFRPTAGQTSYAKRVLKQTQEAEVKKLESEMKAEKEAERDRRIQGIKDKRARKEERERYEKMEAVMHRKRVERLKRRKKRNKKLES